MGFLHFIICLCFLSGDAAVLGGADIIQHEKTCQNRYPNISSTCWVFQSCLEHECKREQGSAVGKCFDGVCNAGENVHNCPADCCPTEKNNNCSLSFVGNDRCPLSCCKNSSCCVERDGDNGGGSLSQVVGSIFGAIVFIILAYLLIKCCLRICSDDNSNIVHPSGSGTGRENFFIIVLRRVRWGWTSGWMHKCMPMILYINCSN